MKRTSMEWVWLLDDILMNGMPQQPRGKLTRELVHNTISIDMQCPVIAIPERHLNYSFMAAEALWIIDGDDKVETLAIYNQRMREFSDDGVTLAGAYGPRIAVQLPYIVDSLIKDRETRQAVLTTWDRNPRPSKDIPCTVAMQFMIRNGKLNLHVFMRSSDAWLGVPYDIFSFSMVAAHTACLFNKMVELRNPVSLGQLYLTMASSHLYSENWDQAREIVDLLVIREGKPIPAGLVEEGRRFILYDALKICRDKTEWEGQKAWRIRP